MRTERQFPALIGLLVLCFSLTTSWLYAQVTITHFPETRQLIPRDLNTNSGIVRIAGTVDSTASFRKLRIRIKRNDQWIQTIDYKLSFVNGIHTFDYQFPIPAELANYRYDLEGITLGSQQPLAVATQVVCGDALVISGQSNAEAKMRDSSAIAYESEFIRVFACGHDDGTKLITQRWQWYTAQGDSHRRKAGNTGQWGLILANRLMNELQIPIAVFNGGHGGKELAFFLPGTNHFDLTTNYGRLMQRIDAAGCRDHVRALFWYQGESDATPDFDQDTYTASFPALSNAWRQDLPWLDHIYLLQIQPGCAKRSTDVLEIMETQRVLANNDPDITLISTTTLAQSTDECHYGLIDGNETLADQLFPFVMKHLYRAPLHTAYEAPQVLSASIAAPNEIVLQLASYGSQLSLDGTAVHQIALNGSTATITDMTLIGESLHLLLDQPVPDVVSISYPIAPTHAQPLIVNETGLGLAGFHECPVSTVAKRSETGVERDRSHRSVQLFPNPASTSLTLVGMLDGSNITVYNCAGAVVKQWSALRSHETLEISSWPQGVYMVQVASDSGTTYHCVSILH